MDDTAKRQALLEQLTRVLPDSAPWTQWLKQSGELPPDFDRMPSVQGLPDPLQWTEDGKTHTVKTARDWETCRQATLAEFHRWILGTVPPPPEAVLAEVVSETCEHGATVRELQLGFGPDYRARLQCELFIPDGDGPFPVFLTQANHRAWGLIALQRGYLACVYAGADSRDDTDTFLEAYPGYDWSRLTRRAWAASRCIDYLETEPRADMARIVITGHSRNGKQSLMASAMDTRIAAVISSSSGAGGCLPTRFYSEQHLGEGIENITRSFPEWFHPRWRFFVGREDRLPVDLHQLVALSAPRDCLLSIAFNDGVESAWAMEKTYLSAKRVYELLGKPNGIDILWRPGGHETNPTVIEQYLDWCDSRFGRGTAEVQERLLYAHDWDAWKENAGAASDPAEFSRHPKGELRKVYGKDAWAAMRANTLDSVADMLGEEPPRAHNPGGTYGDEPEHLERLFGRLVTPPGVKKESFVFGEYINGDLYVPANPEQERLPAILWLHPANPCHGYAAAYRRGDQAFLNFAQNGFATFCYDQIGYGRRLGEIEGFYDRYPRWSVLGKMVRDARAALDVLTTRENVDPSQVYVVGYGLGALIGLHVCALDERPAGLISVCGPPPFRLDVDDATGGGAMRWAKQSLLLPRLGFFEGHEERIPYDVDTLAACIAPRPVCFVTPQLDREAPLDLMTHVLDSARPIFKLLDAGKRIQQNVPEDYNRFGPEMQHVVLDCLREAGASAKPR